MSGPRLLVVDDHAVVRRGTMEIAGEAWPECVFLEAASLAQALDILERQGCDLAIVDISLPDGSGLDLLRHLSRTRPDVPVLILSMHQEAEYARRALALGAKGYLGKSSAPDELTEALTVMLSGGTYVGADLKADVSPLPAHGDSRAALSPREREVLHRLAGGETVSDVAKRLGVSVKTASTYRCRAMRKLGLKTTADFFRHVLARGDLFG